jgi:pyridoxal 5'-phosphate synthase pdxT subunit
MKIGVLAAQGAFDEHITALHRLGVDGVAVRLLADFEGIDGLIIPGGESTTISKLMLAYELGDRIKTLVADGMPVLGTCAGMIVLAKKIIDANGVKPLGVMGITVRRNAFGRQVDSFETDLVIPLLGLKPFHAVFIRAPQIERVDPGVEVLSKLDDDTIIAAKQGNAIVCSFHPELTDDLRFHEYFINLVATR